MPKFKSLTAKKIIKVLQKNGFTLDRSRGSHQIYYNKITKRIAVVPYHIKDLPIGTLLEILRQAGIKKEDI